MIRSACLKSQNVSRRSRSTPEGFSCRCLHDIHCMRKPFQAVDSPPPSTDRVEKPDTRCSLSSLQTAPRTIIDDSVLTHAVKSSASCTLESGQRLKILKRLKAYAARYSSLHRQLTFILVANVPR